MTELLGRRVHTVDETVVPFANDTMYVATDCMNALCRYDVLFPDTFCLVMTKNDNIVQSSAITSDTLDKSFHTWMLLSLNELT